MDKTTALELSNRAAQLKKEGREEQAIALYQQAIELDPSCHKYYYQLANILRQQEKFTEANSYYRKAIELNSNDSWSYYSLGEILAKQNQIEEAIQSYQKSIDLNANYSWSHYNLARLLHQQNRLDEARVYYQQAITLNPDYSWAHHFIGNIYTATGQTQLAIEHYQQAIKFNSTFYFSYDQLGYNFYQQEQFLEAINYYQQAIELKPNHFDSYYYLAEACIQTNQTNLAIDYYQKAIDLHPQSLHIYFKIGQLLLSSSKSELETYRQSLANKSNLIKAYFAIGLGQAWEAKQEFDQTMNCYLEAIAIDPTLELPHQLLQYLPLTLERIDLLIKFYRDLTETRSNIALAWGNLGDFLSEREELKPAIECYQKSCYYKAIDQNPNLANFDLNLFKLQIPDFIILGAAKCGTTSLFEYLKQHPQILLPHKKEIDFFSKYFHRGRDWYLSHFSSIAEANNFITGEASTRYFDCAEVDVKIKQMLPQTKLIILLRNPVERTISDYYHHVNRGVETRTLQEIVTSTQLFLKKATKRELAYTDSEFNYILTSIYYPKIQRWINQFDREQILVIASESLFQDPRSVMTKVFQFLDVDFYDSNKYNQYNIGSYPKVADELKQNLHDIFQSYNRQLEEYLKSSFNW
jgi:tetratricopeptide (TPR) repeat protein